MRLSETFSMETSTKNLNSFVDIAQLKNQFIFMADFALCNTGRWQQKNTKTSE